MPNDEKIMKIDALNHDQEIKTTNESNKVFKSSAAGSCMRIVYVKSIT